MAVIVEINDRLYDYTDEEKATEAVSQFMETHGLDEISVVTIWADANDPRHAQIEKVIFDAVDQNGTQKRALESVPGGITISLS
ncbi:hypothetical protein [Asticcacaulis sp.]|uniref:hypothetical protein n=1 Tax=Asticcacaulis sp. TaxID=1872648 RepID=UPI002602303D|nr:hypothetical protein [Asticcacaulis sp.]